MDAIVAERTDARTRTGAGRFINDRRPRERTGALFPDPLDEDGAQDEIVITTRRAIGRVALVATEAAARFQREAVEHDPMSWMFAPREVFGGAAAIDACLSRDDCMRGILLHGLGLGLDAERGAMDALLASDEDDFDEHEFRHLYGERRSGSRIPNRGRSAHVHRVRLYTATIPDATNLDWCCSMTQVDWRSRGFDGRVLGYLLLQAGYYHCGHRASADVDALIQMLRHEDTGGRTALAEMIATGSKPTWIVRARGTHFDLKDALRARGYRWDPAKDRKVWWREVADDQLVAEQFWLASNVYAADARSQKMCPEVVRVTPRTRFL